MEKSFITSDGARLCYVDEGEGDVLILLHGWSQSAAMFRNQIAEFGKTRRVIALDFRGHGTSPKADRGYRIYRFAADVAELMDHEGIARVSVLGWSMGVSVLWAFIDIYGTSRLDRLIFCRRTLLRYPAARHVRRGSHQRGSPVRCGDDGCDSGSDCRCGWPPPRVKPFLGSMITKGIARDLRDWLLAENLLVDCEGCRGALCQSLPD